MSKAKKHPADVICEVLERIDGRCMAVDGPVPPTLRMATDEELREVYVAADLIRQAEKKSKSVTVAAYLLRRIQDDPRLAYYFDPLTESMQLLTVAYAAQEGLEVEAFRERYYAQLRFEKPICAECGGER